MQKEKAEMVRGQLLVEAVLTTEGSSKFSDKKELSCVVCYGG